MTNREKPEDQKQEQRSHRRLPMNVPVSIELDGPAGPVTVQNRDISWGGVRFAVPKRATPKGDAVTINFPWTKGNKFSANAEVLRTETLDDEHNLIAARFSSLSTADQRRLEKLLQMLQDAAGVSQEEQPPLVPILEVLVGDADEMRNKLGELAEGGLSVTVFEAYKVNQSIRLLFGEIAEKPPLRLRARVTKVKPITDKQDSTWTVFDVRLQFEHPLQELRAAAASLLKQLPRQPETALGMLQGSAISAAGERAYH